nr:hypothetical protein [uncultured Pseudomonas sp.]
MDCYICGTEAHSLQGVDHERIACPGCGDYKISGTALALMKQHNWKFDVDITRRWIADHQGTGEIPLINSQIAAQVIYTK